MSEEDRESQEDELLALASIYDDQEFHRANSAQGGEMQLCLELPPDFKVVVKGMLLEECLVTLTTPFVCFVCYLSLDYVDLETLVKGYTIIIYIQILQYIIIGYMHITYKHIT